MLSKDHRSIWLHHVRDWSAGGVKTGKTGLEWFPEVAEGGPIKRQGQTLFILMLSL